MGLSIPVDRRTTTPWRAVPWRPEDGRSAMASVRLRVNGQDRTVQADGNTMLQFALRDDLDLTGTKFGCGAAQCGCCTVHLDGQPVRSCVTPVAAAVGKEITTIEGLASADALHLPVTEPAPGPLLARQRRAGQRPGTRDGARRTGGGGRPRPRLVPGTAACQQPAD